ncbi:hypothetical protein D9619_010164 [Psilocybe cf. subviscida]|uniref:Uncharacterized protein n=1 Tax=Psilocybe cf. subviscida TaxID=2480587 RepID=A0A8H5AT06_9AGAR|nr:hypothetical protein D9619_010164 [Psilocybe cf. subviscida]
MNTLQFILPAELFRQIIGSGVLDPGDLYSVSLASRWLRDEAQRILFMNPEVFYVHLNGEQGRTAAAFFDSIISSPHRLALMVYAYTQTTNWANGMESHRNVTSRRNREELFTKMTDALKLMVNLKVFRSSDGGRAATHPRVSMVDCICQCRFKLTEFAWKHEGDEIRLLEEFLASQDEVTYFNLHTAFDIRGSSDTANTYVQRLLIAGQKVCPKLEVLCGPMSSSRVILPGKKNVKFIAWTWSFDETEAIEDTEVHVTHVGDSLRTLQYLEYAGGDFSGLPFTTIAPYLSNLIILTICNEVITEVSELSCELPALCAIHFFHLGSWIVSNPDELSKDCTLVSSMFTLFKRLKFVDVDRQVVRSSPESVFYRDLISHRYIVSPETREVTSTRVNRSEKWWGDRVRLVAELSADI